MKGLGGLGVWGSRFGVWMFEDSGLLACGLRSRV